MSNVISSELSLGKWRISEGKNFYSSIFTMSLVY